MSGRRYDGRAAGAGELPPVESTGEILGPCPSCGALVSIGTTPDPRNKNRPTRMLMHPMPFCHYFGATDANVIERAIAENEVVS